MFVNRKTISSLLTLSCKSAKSFVEKSEAIRLITWAKASVLGFLNFKTFSLLYSSKRRIENEDNW